MTTRAAREGRLVVRTMKAGKAMTSRSVGEGRLVVRTMKAGQE